uniref:MSP domain-containing protein n=1 Tax=Caenorhabditis japonica TaxID=281687 RepID=A0A8R1E4G8_CAEJA
MFSQSLPKHRMSLTADPPACTAPAAGGTSTHKLVKAGADKLIFKIKSSNNSEYCISPAYGFVDSSGSKQLTNIMDSRRSETAYRVMRQYALRLATIQLCSLGGAIRE